MTTKTSKEFGQEMAAGCKQNQDFIDRLAAKDFAGAEFTAQIWVGMTALCDKEAYDVAMAELANTINSAK